MIAEVKHLLQKCRNAIIFILVLLTLPILLFIFFHSNIGYKLLITIFILLFEIHIIYVCGYFSLPIYLDKITTLKNESICGSYDNKYSVVLIGNNLQWWKNISTHAFVHGSFFLKKYFKNTNKNYVILPKIDMADFDRYVLDDKCQELYLVGHGSKGSFRINEERDENDGIIYYSKYKDAPKKRIIAQLHCANLKSGENNESLVDLLATDKDNSYVGCGTIYFPNEWWYCFKMWKNNRPKKMK